MLVRVQHAVLSLSTCCGKGLRSRLVAALVLADQPSLREQSPEPLRRLLLCFGGGIGIRGCLKSNCPKGREGSIPSQSTNRNWFFLSSDRLEYCRISTFLNYGLWNVQIVGHGSKTGFFTRPQFLIGGATSIRKLWTFEEAGSTPARPPRVFQPEKEGTQNDHV